VTSPAFSPSDVDSCGVRPRWAEVERLLDAVLELDPARWSEHLDEACGDAAELRDEVASLLGRHAHLEGFLETPPVACTSGPAVGRGAGLLPRPGRLGPYRIVEEIARGGMAEVFRAERADGQFEQRVAVKILRAGLQTEEMICRFRAERQILAGVDHPSVARLVDGGVTGEGRPYLVTEYVEGVPIDRYCAEHGLPLRERLRLFLSVTEAVEHAHRRRVIHRDLKPSNILVTGAGRVKLLDFGIAKLLVEDEGSPTGPFTRPGRRWMTPEYAAPEQVTGGPVTTGTDVYQLGVVLYELLSGRHPFESEIGRPHPLERAIVETTPKKPSAAVGAEGQGDLAPRGPPHEARSDPDALARARASPHPKLRRSLRGDLDAVVLRALRKDPKDRYGSARALAEDLQRYLRGRPVAARRGTAAYRAKKFVVRHPWEVGAVAALVLLLAGFAAFAAFQAGKLARERARASSAVAEARDVTGALASVLRAGDPWEAGVGDTVATRALLGLGLRQVKALEGRPGVQAGLLEVLAGVHASLGSLEEAEAHARRSLRLRRRAGEEDPELAVSLNTLADVLGRRDRFAEAEELHREALALQVRSLGPRHPGVAATLTLLGHRVARDRLAGARELYERALEIRRSSLAPDHPLVAASLMDLGRIARASGDPGEAEAAFREAIEIRRRSLGAEHPGVAASMVYLADLYRELRNDGRRAEALYRRALEIQRSALGEGHPALVHPMGNLARLLSDRGEHVAAERLAREALEVRRRAFGREHRSTAEGRDAVAEELHRQGRLAESERLRRETLRLWKRTVGPEHWAYAGALTGLADLLVDRGKYDEAEALYRRAREIRARLAGAEHFNIGLIIGSLGRLHTRRGDYARAESLYHEALSIVLRERTPSHPGARRLRRGLAELYAARGGEEPARHRSLPGPRD